jgi:hypothetical protein
LTATDQFRRKMDNRPKISSRSSRRFSEEVIGRSVLVKPSAECSRTTTKDEDDYALAVAYADTPIRPNANTPYSGRYGYG